MRMYVYVHRWMYAYMCMYRCVFAYTIYVLYAGHKIYQEYHPRGGIPGKFYAPDTLGGEEGKASAHIDYNAEKKQRNLENMKKYPFGNF